MGWFSYVQEQKQADLKTLAKSPFASVISSALPKPQILHVHTSSGQRGSQQRLPCRTLLRLGLQGKDQLQTKAREKLELLSRKNVLATSHRYLLVDSLRDQLPANEEGLRAVSGPENLCKQISLSTKIIQKLQHAFWLPDVAL